MSTAAPSRPLSLPDPTPVLFALALACAWAIFFVDSTELRLLILGVVAAPFVVAIAAWVGMRAYLTMVLLIVASTLPRLAVEIGKLNARPEHVVAGVAVLALPWLWNRREGRVEWLRADWLLGSYCVVILISSWFQSPEPGQTIKWAAQQLLAIVPYFVLRIVAGGEGSFKRAFRVLLLVGALESIYAILIVYSNLFFNTTVGIEVEQYDATPAVYGTQFEANLLGSFCGAGAVMMMLMYLKERKREYLWGYMLSFAGMALSFSRGALLASALVLSFVVWRGLRRAWMDKRVFWRIAGATVLVIALIGPVLIPGYIERFSTVDVSDASSDPTTGVRAFQLMIGLDEFTHNPLLGSGTASFQLQFDWQMIGEETEASGWLGNTEIRVLHDTGLIGFALFVSVLGSLALAARRVLRSGDHPELLALVLGALVYTVTFQFTEGTLLAFSWVHLGLIASGVALYRRQAQDALPPA